MKKLLSFLLLSATLLTGCGHIPSPEPAVPQTTAATQAPSVPQALPSEEETEPAQASSLPAYTEASVPLSPEAYQVVYTYMLTDDNQEYYSFQGLDPEKNIVWTRETSHTAGAQICPASPVGTMNGRFYYCDDGSLVALDAATGEILWENPDFGGSIGSQENAMLDPNGFIYLCGYFGPELFVCDTEGNTVKKIRSLSETGYWPASLTLSGNELLIHLEGGSEAGEDVSVPMDWIPQAMG